MQAHLLMPYPSKSGSMGGGAPSSSGGAAGAAAGGVDQADGYGAAAAGGAAGSQAAAGAAGVGGAAAAAQAPLRSIYALAVNAGGSVVAVGTTDSHIRLLDPRTGDKVMKLKVNEQQEGRSCVCADHQALLQTI